MTLCGRQDWKTRRSERMPLLHTISQGCRIPKVAFGSTSDSRDLPLPRLLSGVKQTSNPTKIPLQTMLCAMIRLSRLLSALLCQASTEVQISIKLLIAHDSAIISMGVTRSKILGS